MTDGNQRDVCLEKLNKKELAGMLRLTYRYAVRPDRSKLMRNYTKSQLIAKLKQIQEAKEQ